MPIQQGYVFIPIDHWEPGCQDDGKGHFYQKEHVVVAERILGRKLTEDEVVHHVDGNKTNNDPRNLMVLTRAQHSALHTRLDNPNPPLRAGQWSKRWKACRGCGTTAQKHYAQGYCESCYRSLRRHRK